MFLTPLGADAATGDVEPGPDCSVHHGSQHNRKVAHRDTLVCQAYNNWLNQAVDFAVDGVGLVGPAVIFRGEESS